MDLGIVAPRLEGRGEPESYLRSCLERWQPHLHLTLYTAEPVRGRESVLGIDTARTAVVALPETAGAGDAAAFPASWVRRVREHDAYLFFETPPPPRRFQPSVWCRENGRGRPPGATRRPLAGGAEDELLMRLCRAARRSAGVHPAG